MPPDRPVRHLRTLFISDVHLGARGCQADLLLDFLRCHDAETIYLVGDIVDGWRLKRNWHWPQSHNDVAQKILRKARKGARIIYLPGMQGEAAGDRWIERGLIDAGAADTRIFDWVESWWPFKNLRNRENHKRAADKLAKKLRELVDDGYRLEVLDEHMQVNLGVHVHEYNLVSLCRASRRAGLPGARVWIHADLLRSGAHRHTKSLESHPLARLANRLGGLAPVRFFLGNDLYLRARKPA